MKKIIIMLIVLLSLSSCFKEKEINESLLIEKYNQETLTLDLSNNSIEEIPNLADFLTWSTLKEIKYINLSGNKIKNVKLLSFDKFTSLEEIDLSNNQITWINLQKVNSEKINLNNNEIEKISISGSWILEIDLGDNLLTFWGDIKLPSTITTLNLEKNNLQNLDWFKNYRLIKEINLNSNKLDNKDLENLKWYRNLKKLEISNNNLSEKDLERIKKFNENEVKVENESKKEIK